MTRKSNGRKRLREMDRKLADAKSDRYEHTTSWRRQETGLRTPRRYTASLEGVRVRKSKGLERKSH